MELRMILESVKHWLGFFNSKKVRDSKLLDDCKKVNKKYGYNPYQLFRIGYFIMYRDEFNNFYLSYIISDNNNRRAF